MKILSWLARILGKVKLPFIIKEVNGEDYYKMRDDLEVGDVILCTTKGWLMNLFNPSEFKHGSIYIGGEKIKFVIESSSKGVVKTNLIDALLSRDRFIVKRLVSLSDEQKQRLIIYLKSKLGLEYDWSFNKSDDKYYCFELIIDAYKQVVKDMNIESYKRLGKEVYLSQSFNSWQTIYNSK